jgi:DNA repair protein RadD
MKLRVYQQEASDAVINELRRSVAPIMIEAATGAGKSLIIADIAHRIHKLTGKRILCTAPQSELVVQNASKYRAIGEPCSMFSASAGVKSTRHPVIFGSPLTIKNRISAFQKDFALVVIDECDQITPTLKAIIDAMRIGNPNLRVVGLTATPFRLGSGYIYREGPDGKCNGEDTAREPYFAKSVYRIDAPALISMGFLTRPIVGGINTEGYDTHGLLPNKAGKFSSADVDKAYHGHGRITSAIVGDIVRQAQNRRGVLIYAATVQHAQEVLASLPPELSDIVTADTTNRKQILARMAAQKIKYVVNVGVLTVGVDLPHVDVIAILRKTESVRLLQQIIGRGLRLYDGKTDCLVLDYTTNLDDHGLSDADLFSPKVKASATSGGSGVVIAHCPACGHDNEFSRHKDAEGYELDVEGYCLDVFGQRVETEYGPLPGHHGRRCMGFVTIGRGEHVRCAQRYTSKPCPTCDAPNDIAARYCCECKSEIVNPGDRLIAEFKAMKRDPSIPQTDRVLSLDVKESISQRGNETIRADWKTEFRQFSTWYTKNSAHPRAKKDLERFQSATEAGQPETVSYVKDTASGFFRTISFNQPEDVAP